MPTGRELIVSDAVAPAKAPTAKKVLLPAVPVTGTALPSWVVPEKNVTVPLGAAPLLVVVTVAFSVTGVPWLTVVPAAGDDTEVAVVAETTVIGKVKLGLVLLGRKLLSPG